MALVEPFNIAYPSCIAPLPVETANPEMKSCMAKRVAQGHRVLAKNERPSSMSWRLVLRDRSIQLFLALGADAAWRSQHDQGCVVTVMSRKIWSQHAPLLVS